MDDALLIEIQQICRLAHERNLQELAIIQPDFSISVIAMPGAVTTAAPVRSMCHAPVTSQHILGSPVPVVEGYAITSPLVGIFYRAPSPDATSFVEVGDSVEVGDTIGIVEAMKVFNEITTDCAGIVIAIPTENGKLVQAGQPLVIIETME